MASKTAFVALAGGLVLAGNSFALTSVVSGAIQAAPLPNRGPSLAPVSAWSDLVVLQPSTLREIAGTNPAAAWLHARIDRETPTFDRTGLLVAIGKFEYRDSFGAASVERWNLDFNSAYASTAYSQFQSTGYSSWSERLEPGSSFGRSDFRPDPQMSVGAAETFRMEQRQNPAYSYGLGGF